MVLLPDAELGQRMEGEEKARIEAFRKTLDEKQVGGRGWEEGRGRQALDRKQVGGLGREVGRGGQATNEKRVNCSSRQRMQGRRLTRSRQVCDDSGGSVQGCLCNWSVQSLVRLPPMQVHDINTDTEGLQTRQETPDTPQQQITWANR